MTGSCAIISPERSCSSLVPAARSGARSAARIAQLDPKTLLLLDASEFNLYAIHQELAATATDADTVVPLLASVRDRRRVNEIVATWRPDTIYHAAAYKHVPMVEHNVLEGIANNVLGTLNVAVSARTHGVESFVLISTDKAVRPTNVMGATKRLAEMVLQALNADGLPGKFSVVRFGNVLGSSGSVIPHFRAQIAAGGPITITHPEITRYFMTIPEAGQLVIQAGAMAQGGDVFVLDMGEPIRIIDLARSMIELSGLRVLEDGVADGDVAIKCIGLRPGEKLFEELLIGNNSAPSAHPRILRADEHFIAWAELRDALDRLSAVIDAGDPATARRMLTDLVAEFAPNSELVDLVAMRLDETGRLARPFAPVHDKGAHFTA